MDRIAGADANNIIQNYTDIMPGRPTMVEHRAPEDDLRDHYVSAKADPLTKRAYGNTSLRGAAQQVRDAW